MYLHRLYVGILNFDQRELYDVIKLYFTLALIYLTRLKARVPTITFETGSIYAYVKVNSSDFNGFCRHD